MGRFCFYAQEVLLTNVYSNRSKPVIECFNKRVQLGYLLRLVLLCRVFIFTLYPAPSYS